MRARVTLLLLSALLGACASPGRRWRPSAELGSDCAVHSESLLGDRRGVLREVDGPGDIADASWDALGFGEFQITRGQGGWWAMNKGAVTLAGGQTDGALWWLADDRREFERLADGRYVGVVVDETGPGDSILALRSDCRVGAFNRGISYAIIERLTRTSTGWSAPVEVQRFGGLCPYHAIADAQGRALMVTWITASDDLQLEVLRVEGDRLRSLGGFAVQFPDDAGPQIDRTQTGDLLISSGYSAYSEDPDDPVPIFAAPPKPTRLLRWIDEDHLVAGWLIRSCRATPMPSTVAPQTPERALGISVTHPNPLTIVNIRPDYTDLAAIVDYVATLPPPVLVGAMGLDLRGQQAEFLRLPPQTSLLLSQSTSTSEWDALQRERPDLFTDTAWSRDYN